MNIFDPLTDLDIDIEDDPETSRLMIRSMGCTIPGVDRDKTPAEWLPPLILGDGDSELPADSPSCQLYGELEKAMEALLEPSTTAVSAQEVRGCQKDPAATWSNETHFVGQRVSALHEKQSFVEGKVIAMMFDGWTLEIEADGDPFDVLWLLQGGGLVKRPNSPFL